MKRTSFKQRTTALKAKTPMKKVSSKRKAYRDSDEGRAAMAYMGKVKQLPCAVSGKPPPSDAHHPICGRYGSRKSSDFDVIPLAPEFHRHPYPDAIHTNKTAWVDRFGLDTDYIEQTRRMVGEME